MLKKLGTYMIRALHLSAYGRENARSPTPSVTVVEDDDLLVPAAEPARLDATYRIWAKGGEWLWEVSSTRGDNLGFGRAASSLHARVAAFTFWLDHR
jgi:hypothetical protein